MHLTKHYPYFAIFMCFIDGRVFCDENSQSNNCDPEYINLEREYKNCGQYDSDNEWTIYQKMKDLLGNVTTEYEFGQFIDELCPKRIRTLECCGNLKLNISSNCLADKRINIKLNAIRHLTVATDVFCPNNGKKYKDLIKGDGPTCIVASPDGIECYRLQRPLVDIRSEEVFTNLYVCHIFDIMRSCLPIYNECSNKDVLKHLSEFIGKVRDEFKCIL